MITLTIPNDDTIALRQFGKALIEIASAKEGHIDGVTVTPLVISTDVKEPEVDTTAQQVESLAAHDVNAENFTEVTGTAPDNDLPIITVDPTCHALSNEELQERGFDSTGTPWDERIHSTSKALNADGTWRLRRKPKDMDEAQWAKYIEAVKTDVTDANDDSWDTDRRPGSGGNGGVGIGESDDIEPPVTPPGDDYHTDTDVVTEQTVVGIPPLPVPPPVVVAPPVPEFDDGVPFPPSGTVSPALERMADHSVWDFPRLMTFLTERHGKIDVATVNTLLAQDGMSSVQELNAHPDKIGPFVVRVKAHLGE